MTSDTICVRVVLENADDEAVARLGSADAASVRRVVTEGFVDLRDTRPTPLCVPEDLRLAGPFARVVPAQPSPGQPPPAGSWPPRSASRVSRRTPDAAELVRRGASTAAVHGGRAVTKITSGELVGGRERNAATKAMAAFALLELQRQDLPLIARQRSLRPWERPWEVTP